MQPYENSGLVAETLPQPIDCEVVKTSFRDARWRWSDVIIGLVPVLMLTSIHHFAPHYKEHIPSWLSSLVSLSGQAWLLLYPLIMVRYRGVEPRPPKLRQIAFEAIFTIPTLFAIWVVLMIVASLWSLIVQEPVTPENPISNLVETLNPWVILALGLLAVVLAPISEETFFRGMVYNKLRTAMPIWLAIVLQGLLFGFVHTFGFTHAVLASILGMGLGIIYELRGKLVASMFVHALQNFTALSLTIVLAVLFSHAAKLGINAEPQEGGLRITVVQPGSPADKAGLKPGDILMAVDDERVHNMIELRLRMLAKGGGDKVKITFRRDGQEQQTTLVLEGPPAFLPQFKLSPQPGPAPIPPVVPAR